MIAGLGFVISLIFLVTAFRNLKPADVVDSIEQASPAWLVAGAIVYFVAVSVISLRWQYLLRAIKMVSLKDLIPLVAIGYMGNNIYPFRSGEVLRIVLLQRNHSIPFAKGTTTVLIERVFDGLVMLTFVVISLVFVDVSSPEIHAVAIIAAPIFLTALFVFFVLAAKPDILRRIILLIARYLPQKLGHVLLQTGEEIIAGLEGLRSLSSVIGTIVSSYSTWAIEAGVYWLVSFAFNLNVGYDVMLLIVGVVNLAGLIPASPGQLGVFEFLVSTVLIGVGIADTLAIAYALVVHVVIWLPVTIAGLLFLFREGLNWQAIAQAQKLEHEAAT